MLLQLFSWDIRNHIFQKKITDLQCLNFPAYLRQPELSVKLGSPDQLFLYLIILSLSFQSMHRKFSLKKFYFFLILTVLSVSLYFPNNDFGSFKVIKQFDVSALMVSVFNVLQTCQKLANGV